MKRELIRLNYPAAICEDDGVVPCYRIGDLALHNVYVDGRPSERWLISHIPTGQRVCALPLGLRFKDAGELTMLLNDAFDWEHITVENAREIQDDVRAFLKRTIGRFDNGWPVEEN